MTAAEVRHTFLKFFESKGHTIVPSAPIVVKNDPTLMFTNAGMNQFKDWFLGNEPAKYKRVVDTQKCLRVSGKHNDLEEVGVDTYHHTMFEMLGNWSFGDYFKKEAIEWAWELLTEVYKLPKDRLYVTVFEGDAKEGLAFDQEAFDNWKLYIAENRILNGNKKDNFWEMGDTGPCGPCTEIHIDLRPDAERTAVNGATLVNNDHPQVIEIWNNVFMEFNRKADGSLEKLPAQHVDTGMGFERLVRAIEGKSSNYDTDVFVPTIKLIEKHSGIKYGFSNSDDESIGHIERRRDVAMRVMADHIRAICFAIADGQLPSNNGAGYVIRRILRRAVRYQYQFLNVKEPFMCKLAELIADTFKDVFPELYAQKDFVVKVVREEELSFLRTLENGLRMLNKHIEYLRDIEHLIEKFIKEKSISDDDFFDIDKRKIHNFTGQLINRIAEYPVPLNGGFSQYDFTIRLRDTVFTSVEEDNQYVINLSKFIPAKVAFELFDTHGFPFDLTRLIISENGFNVSETEFTALLAIQKHRSRKATELTVDDWVVVREEKPTSFVGYDKVKEEGCNIIKYRKVNSKGKELYQIVLDKTPFYPEGGGQIGDTGRLDSDAEELFVLDTKRENNLIIHFVHKLPEFAEATFTATVDVTKRRLTEANHSATHLLHAALRSVLGTHVHQKGSLVNNEYLRFDFSHFAAMTADEIAQVEHIVNQKVRENISLDERRAVPIAEAQTMGAMMLFGEKYGESVRVITFDDTYSRELCGGTHVKATGQIGLFKITSEAAVAAGVRRIEAITADAAELFVNDLQQTVTGIKNLLSTNELVKSVEQLIGDKAELLKKLEVFENEKTVQVKGKLKSEIRNSNGANMLIAKVEISSAEQLKNLSFQLKAEVENLVCVLGCILNGKPMLSIIISDNLVTERKLHAGNLVKELAKEIQGGGGGQPFYATAGGNNVAGLDAALAKASTIL